MTIPLNFTINTGWVYINHKTSTLYQHRKKLNPTEPYLFDIFPTEILTDIDVWVSSLEHYDKLKAVIKNMNTLSTPHSSTFLLIYGLPTTISASIVVGIMRDFTSGNISAYLIRTVNLVCAISYSGVIIQVLAS